MNIAQTIGLYREQSGKTYKQLAEETGLSISYLSDIERGRSKPTIETLAKVVTAMGFSLAEFFGATELMLSTSELRLIEAVRLKDYPTALRLIAQDMQIND